MTWTVTCRNHHRTLTYVCPSDTSTI